MVADHAGSVFEIRVYIFVYVVTYIAEDRMMYARSCSHRWSGAR